VNKIIAVDKNIATKYCSFEKEKSFCERLLRRKFRKFFLTSLHTTPSNGVLPVEGCE